MRSFAVLLLPIVVAVVFPASAAEVLGPVCAQPAVLEKVVTMLREAGRPMGLQPSPIGEVSVGPGRIVHCAARGQMLGYDTNRHGMQPIDALFVVNYTLELRRNGIFLSLQ